MATYNPIDYIPQKARMGQIVSRGVQSLSNQASDFIKTISSSNAYDEYYKKAADVAIDELSPLLDNDKIKASMVYAKYFPKKLSSESASQALNRHIKEGQNFQSYVAKLKSEKSSSLVDERNAALRSTANKAVSTPQTELQPGQKTIQDINTFQPTMESESGRLQAPEVRIPQVDPGRTMQSPPPKDRMGARIRADEALGQMGQAPMSSSEVKQTSISDMPTQSELVRKQREDRLQAAGKYRDTAKLMNAKTNRLKVLLEDAKFDDRYRKEAVEFSSDIAIIGKKELARLSEIQRKLINQKQNDVFFGKDENGNEVPIDKLIDNVDAAMSSINSDIVEVKNMMGKFHLKNEVPKNTTQYYRNGMPTRSVPRTTSVPAQSNRTPVNQGVNRNDPLNLGL